MGKIRKPGKPPQLILPRLARSITSHEFLVVCTHARRKAGKNRCGNGLFRIR